MNNNSASAGIRKATTAEFPDVNKSAHMMKKALMATDGKKGSVSFEASVKEVEEPKPKVVRSSSPPKAKRSKVVEEKEIPSVASVADFIAKHF